MKFKTCRTCNQELQATEFYKNKANKDGLFLHCKPCTQANIKAWKLANPDKIKLFKEKYRERNIERKRQWREANRELYNARATRWRHANLEKHRLSEQRWRRANPSRKLADVVAYRVGNATPPWITSDHLAQMAEWYTIAKELQWLSEEKLHVDHIVPLNGEIVSGLHVPWNLQILPASENIKKGNKLAEAA